MLCELRYMRAFALRLMRGQMMGKPLAVLTRRYQENMKVQEVLSLSGVETGGDSPDGSLDISALVLLGPRSTCAHPQVSGDTHRKRPGREGHAQPAPGCNPHITTTNTMSLWTLCESILHGGAGIGAHLPSSGSSSCLRQTPKHLA